MSEAWPVSTLIDWHICACHKHAQLPAFVISRAQQGSGAVVQAQTIDAHGAVVDDEWELVSLQAARDELRAHELVLVESLPVVHHPRQLEVWSVMYSIAYPLARGSMTAARKLRFAEGVAEWCHVGGCDMQQFNYGLPHVFGWIAELGRWSDNCIYCGKPLTREDAVARFWQAER